MSIDRLEFYRVNPIEKVNTDTDFLKKDSKNFDNKKILKDKNLSKEKSFDEIFRNTYAKKNK